MTDPIFASLGLFIIDENRYPPKSGRPNDYNIIGGGASYAILGARMVCGPTMAPLVTGIVDMGRDFPPVVAAELKSWRTGVVFRRDDSRLTTRGANVYDDNDIRHFEYQTPKLRVEVADIIATGLAYARWFHFCCSIERCLESVDTLVAQASQRPGGGLVRPQFIFEPAPEACVAANYDELVRMLPHVDVFTPNLNEACAFIGRSPTANLPTTAAEIAEVADHFSPYLAPHAGLVLRCGPIGCYVRAAGVDILLPAYHQDQAQVVDVTGGGNSFCGAFAAALHLTQDWVLAGMFGNLVSGCIIEHLGVAQLTGDDEWNGLTMRQRLEVYVEQNKKLLGEKDLLKIDWI